MWFTEKQNVNFGNIMSLILLFDGSQDSFSPSLGLWRFTLDSAVFFVQIVNNIIVVVESVVVHVVVLQETWSWICFNVSSEKFRLKLG